MARVSWLDDESDIPTLDEHLVRLDHFTTALADGIVDQHELDTQQAALVAAMKAVENDLDDATHAKVTQLLLELTAYNVMTTLHQLASERVRTTFADQAVP